MSLVKRIDALCKERNTTLTAIERECGLGVSSIRKWDEHSPSLSKVMSVADALDVPVSYLIGEDTEKKPAPTDGDGLSETARQIMECVNRMSPKEQETFLAWLQASQGRG